MDLLSIFGILSLVGDVSSLSTYSVFVSVEGYAAPPLTFCRSTTTNSGRTAFAIRSFRTNYSSQLIGKQRRGRLFVENGSSTSNGDTGGIPESIAFFTAAIPFDDDDRHTDAVTKASTSKAGDTKNIAPLITTFPNNSDKTIGESILDVVDAQGANAKIVLEKTSVVAKKVFDETSVVAKDVLLRLVEVTGKVLNTVATELQKNNTSSSSSSTGTEMFSFKLRPNNDGSGIDTALTSATGAAISSTVVTTILLGFDNNGIVPAAAVAAAYLSLTDSLVGTFFNTIGAITWDLTTSMTEYAINEIQFEQLVPAVINASTSTIGQIATAAVSTASVMTKKIATEPTSNIPTSSIPIDPIPTSSAPSVDEVVDTTNKVMDQIQDGTAESIIDDTLEVLSSDDDDVKNQIDKAINENDDEDDVEDTRRLVTFVDEDDQIDTADHFGSVSATNDDNSTEMMMFSEQVDVPTSSTIPIDPIPTSSAPSLDEVVVTTNKVMDQIQDGTAESIIDETQELLSSYNDDEFQIDKAINENDDDDDVEDTLRLVTAVDDDYDDEDDQIDTAGHFGSVSTTINDNSHEMIMFSKQVDVVVTDVEVPATVAAAEVQMAVDDDLVVTLPPTAVSDEDTVENNDDDPDKIYLEYSPRIATSAAAIENYQDQIYSAYQSLGFAVEEDTNDDIRTVPVKNYPDQIYSAYQSLGIVVEDKEDTYDNVDNETTMLNKRASAIVDKLKATPLTDFVETLDVGDSIVVVDVAVEKQIFAQKMSETNDEVGKRSQLTMEEDVRIAEDEKVVAADHLVDESQLEEVVVSSIKEEMNVIVDDATDAAATPPDVKTIVVEEDSIVEERGSIDDEIKILNADDSPEALIPVSDPLTKTNSIEQVDAAFEIHKTIVGDNEELDVVMEDVGTIATESMEPTIINKENVVSELQVPAVDRLIDIELNDVETSVVAAIDLSEDSAPPALGSVSNTNEDPFRIVEKEAGNEQVVPLDHKHDEESSLLFTPEQLSSDSMSTIRSGTASVEGDLDHIYSAYQSLGSVVNDEDDTNDDVDNETTILNKRASAIIDELKTTPAPKFVETIGVSDLMVEVDAAVDEQAFERVISEIEAKVSEGSQVTLAEDDVRIEEDDKVVEEVLLSEEADHLMHDTQIEEPAVVSSIKEEVSVIVNDVAVTAASLPDVKAMVVEEDSIVEETGSIDDEVTLTTVDTNILGALKGENVEVEDVNADAPTSVPDPLMKINYDNNEQEDATFEIDNTVVVDKEELDIVVDDLATIDTKSIAPARIDLEEEVVSELQSPIVDPMIDIELKEVETPVARTTIDLDEENSPATIESVSTTRADNVDENNAVIVASEVLSFDSMPTILVDESVQHSIPVVVDSLTAEQEPTFVTLTSTTVLEEHEDDDDEEEDHDDDTTIAAVVSDYVIPASISDEATSVFATTTTTAKGFGVTDTGNTINEMNTNKRKVSTKRKTTSGKKKSRKSR